MNDLITMEFALIFAYIFFSVLSLTLNREGQILNENFSVRISVVYFNIRANNILKVFFFF